MAQMVVLDSLNEDIFVCGICKLVFNSLQHFVNHKSTVCAQSSVDRSKSNETIPLAPAAPALRSLESRTDTATTSLSCPATVGCATSTATLAKTPSKMSCHLCKKSFKKTKSLLAHTKTHTEKPYQCPICGRCFIQNSHVQRHLLSHKVWPDGLSETTAKSREIDLLSYSCPYCDTVLTNYNQFRVHLKNHLSLKRYKCIQHDCNSLFDTMETLLDHISTSHNNAKYACHICNKSFSSLEEIASHQQSHGEPNKNKNKHVDRTLQFKCSLCDAIFRRQEKLSLHMLTENHKKTCIHCNKTFASDKRLRLHLQIHRKLKPFQCNVCGASFHMKKYLTTHLLKHGDRSFTCNICKFKFKRQDLLHRHMKLHQGRKLHKCPFKETLGCQMEFSRRDKLESHVKYHTKRLISCSDNNKVEKQDVGTVEICIVPLDGNLTM